VQIKKVKKTKKQGEEKMTKTEFFNLVDINRSVFNSVGTGYYYRTTERDFVLQNWGSSLFLAVRKAAQRILKRGVGRINKYSFKKLSDIDSIFVDREALSICEIFRKLEEDVKYELSPAFFRRFGCEKTALDFIKMALECLCSAVCCIDNLHNRDKVLQY
jgi:hypothetical protein